MLYSDIDIFYMNRCLELAKTGLGNTYPNPLVGSVIVYDGKIIGEGYHKKCGGPHAEINAINSVRDKSILSKSSLYVNLEPCSHQGRTPSCALKLIELKVPRVIISNQDPYFEVAGKGIEMLRKSGADVTVGVLEKEGAELNRRFFTFHTRKRPYIVLKWARTKDGFLDKNRQNNSEKPAWITNDLCRSVVHKWRTEEAAIMVGYNTALLDNPALNVREWSGNLPLRIVTDRGLNLPQNLKLFDGSQQTLVFTEKDVKNNSVNTDFSKIDYSKNTVGQMLHHLYLKNIQSVIIEGGAKLLNSFISENIWDEARIFTGEISFGDGVSAPEISGILVSEENLGGSMLRIYKNSSNA